MANKIKNIFLVAAIIASLHTIVGNLSAGTRKHATDEQARKKTADEQTRKAFQEMHEKELRAEEERQRIKTKLEMEARGKTEDDRRTIQEERELLHWKSVRELQEKAKLDSLRAEAEYHAEAGAEHLARAEAEHRAKEETERELREAEEKAATEKSKAEDLQRRYERHLREHQALYDLEHITLEARWFNILDINPEEFKKEKYEDKIKLIRDQYKKLSFKYHSDKQPQNATLEEKAEADRKFKEVQNAYNYFKKILGLT